MTKEEQNKKLREIFAIIEQTQESKGSDYANTDRLSNFKLAGSIIGLSASQNCLSLIATKVARLGVLLKSRNPKNESIEDSILDLINYGILLSMIESEKEEPKEFTKDEKF